MSQKGDKGQEKQKSGRNNASSSEKKGDKYWSTVLGDEKPSSTGTGSKKNQAKSSSLSEGAKYFNDLNRNADKPAVASSSGSSCVPIAPKGPVASPPYVQDGYFFVCKHEGCQQRYKHQSSACRHYKQSHKK